MSITKTGNGHKNGGAVQTRPSVFDKVLYVYAFLSPIAFWLPWDLNMFQRLFFCFSTLILFLLSISIRKQRFIVTKPIWSYFLISSFFVCLLHSVALKAPSLVQNYLVFTVMVEGFLYILCGFLLYHMVINYSENFNIVYPVIAINVFNFIFVIAQLFGIKLIFASVPTICGLMGTKSQLALFSAVSIPLLFNFRIKTTWYPVVLIPVITLLLSRSHSAFFALSLGTLWFLRKDKNIPRFLIVLLVSMGYVILNIKTILYKLTVRLDLLKTTVGEIFNSPFIGNGYDNGLSMNTIKSNIEIGMMYRHNDLLNFARDLGIPIALMLAYIIWKTIRNSAVDKIWLSAVVLVFGCLMQTNFYFPRIATIGIILLALMERNHYVYKTSA